MATAKHTIMGGKVHIYKRENSRFRPCATYLQVRNRRTSTQEANPARAKDYSEDWYLELRGKQALGVIVDERTFKDAAGQCVKNYEVITEGQRSPKRVEGHRTCLRNHLIAFRRYVFRRMIIPNTYWINFPAVFLFAHKMDYVSGRL